MRTDRVAARTQAGNHLWRSGKHKAFGGNMQVLTDRTGFPVRTAPMEPGSPHLHHRRPGPRPAGTAPGGLTGTAHPPADKSRTGAGIGIKAPAENPAPDPDTRRHGQADRPHTSPGRDSQHPTQALQGPTTRHSHPHSHHHHHRHSPGHPHPPQKPLARKPQ